MKWFAAIASFALMATASPVESREDKITTYQLKTKSSTRSLDGMYLQIRNNTVGVWHDKRAAQQAIVYPIESSKGKVELHTWPIGIVDHVLGLVGGGATLTLKDIMQAPTVPAGTTADWKNFVLKFDPASDNKEGAVAYANGGQWVVFPGPNGGYHVTILTGGGMTTQDYLPIEVVFEVAREQPKF